MNLDEPMTLAELENGSWGKCWKELMAKAKAGYPLTDDEAHFVWEMTLWVEELAKEELN